MQRISWSASVFLVGILLLTLLTHAYDYSGYVQTGTHTPPSTSIKNETDTSSSALALSQYNTSSQWLTFAHPHISLVNHYTTLNASRTSSGITVSLSALKATPTTNTGKCGKVLANANWWGITVYMDHCSISKLGNVKGTAIAAGGIAAALDVFGIGVPILVVIGILNLYANVLVKEDYDCGNTGAYLNVTWLILAWVAPVC